MVIFSFNYKLILFNLKLLYVSDSKIEGSGAEKRPIASELSSKLYNKKIKTDESSNN